MSWIEQHHKKERKTPETPVPFSALSMFRGYGFVQFERAEEAEAAKAGQNGRFYRGYKLGKASVQQLCLPQTSRPMVNFAHLQRINKMQMGNS